MTTALAQTDLGSVPPWLADTLQELRKRKTNELVSLLAETLAATTEKIVTLAGIVRLLEERGYDFSQLRVPWLAYLRRIAQGQVVPEVLSVFMGSPVVLRRVAALPITDQRRLVENKPLRVMTPADDDRGPRYRLLPPSSLTPQQVHQVFAADHVRSEAEQRSWLEAPERRSRRQTREHNVIMNQKRRCIIVTGDRVELTVAQLLDYATKLSQ